MEVNERDVVGKRWGSGKILQQKNRERWNGCVVYWVSERLGQRVLESQEEGGRETRKDPQDERDDEEWRARDGLASWVAGWLFAGPLGSEVKTKEE